MEVRGPDEVSVIDLVVVVLPICGPQAMGDVSTEPRKWHPCRPCRCKAN